jgi:RNA polymerase sigma factor (sigma-70 family)
VEATATSRARDGRFGTRFPDGPERELESLRPLGQRYVRAHFGPGLSPHDAEDVVSEVIARLFQRLERGEEATNLNALFFTSVHNASVDLVRRRRRRPEVALEAAADEQSAAPEPVERALASETGALVRDVLTRIRPRYREALALRFGVGLNTVEIAERKRISVTAAKKLVNRAAHETESELARLDDGERCPEAQDLIRRGLFSRTITEGSAASQMDQLQSHLAHCGSCKSFLSQLRGLNELAGTALVTGSATDAVGRRAGIAQQLSSWAGQLTDAGHAAADRTRLAAFKAGQHLTAADGASAGAITGTAKQITAICATGAAAATCLATGVVGPGIAVSHDRPSTNQQAAAQTVPSTTTPVPTTTTPTPPPAATAPAPTDQPDPVNPTNRELGLGGSSAHASSSVSRDFAAPASASSSGGGGGGGTSSGRENFGP